MAVRTCKNVASRNKKLHGNEYQFATIKFRKGTRGFLVYFVTAFVTARSEPAIYTVAHWSRSKAKKKRKLPMYVPCVQDFPLERNWNAE